MDGVLHRRHLLNEDGYKKSGAKNLRQKSECFSREKSRYATIFNGELNVQGPTCSPSILSYCPRGITYFAILKLTHLLLFFSHGIILLCNTDIYLVNGKYILKIGIAIIVISIFGCINMVICGITGTKQKSNIPIVSYFIIDTLFLFIQILLLRSELIHSTTPLSPRDVRSQCTSASSYIDNGECVKYLSNERTQKIRNIWKGYLDYARGGETKYYLKLFHLQELGNCCGFGPPMQCKNEVKSWIKEEYDDLRQGIFCVGEGWYPPTKECNQNIAILSHHGSNILANEGTNNRGCAFDMAVGHCQFNLIDNTTMGCLSFMEHRINRELSAAGFAISVLSCLQIIIIFISFFYICGRIKMKNLFPHNKFIDKSGC